MRVLWLSKQQASKKCTPQSLHTADKLAPYNQKCRILSMPRERQTSEHWEMYTENFDLLRQGVASIARGVMYNEGIPLFAGLFTIITTQGVFTAFMDQSKQYPDQ